MLATIPLTPTAAHRPSSRTASPHNSSGGVVAERASIWITRPNSSGSRN